MSHRTQKRASNPTLRRAPRPIVTLVLQLIASARGCAKSEWARRYSAHRSGRSSSRASCYSERSELAAGRGLCAYDGRLDRKVAIKLVRSGPDVAASANERLLREARTLAKLSHPTSCRCTRPTSVMAACSSPWSSSTGRLYKNGCIPDPSCPREPSSVLFFAISSLPGAACKPPTKPVWSTVTSSPGTCSSVKTVERAWSISAWPAWRLPTIWTLQNRSPTTTKRSQRMRRQYHPLLPG